MSNPYKHDLSIIILMVKSNSKKRLENDLKVEMKAKKLQKTSSSGNSKMISLVVIILVIIIGTVTAVTFYRNGSDGKNYDEFAMCLAEKDAVMYGSEGCTHCMNQKLEFGTSFQYVKYVECPLDLELCRAVGIVAYPTWIINGEKYTGEQPLETLADLTGCELPISE